MLSLQVVVLAVLVLHQLLDTVDFDLTDVNFMLERSQLDFGLVMSLFLGSCNSVKLNAHVLDLLGLGMIDVSLASDVLVALLDLELRSFILFSHFALAILRLGQLDFDVAQRILQFLVLNFAESQHLAILNFRALLVLDAQATAYNAFILSTGTNRSKSEQSSSL
jgi:hypothetical protein